MLFVTFFDSVSWPANSRTKANGCLPTPCWDRLPTPSNSTPRSFNSVVLNQRTKPTDRESNMPPLRPHQLRRDFSFLPITWLTIPRTSKLGWARPGSTTLQLSMMAVQSSRLRDSTPWQCNLFCSVSMPNTTVFLNMARLLYVFWWTWGCLPYTFNVELWDKTIILQFVLSESPIVQLVQLTSRTLHCLDQLLVSYPTSIPPSMRPSADRSLLEAIKAKRQHRLGRILSIISNLVSEITWCFLCRAVIYGVF